MMHKAPSSSKLQRGAVSGVALAKVGIHQLGHQARQFIRDDEEKKIAQDHHDAHMGRILFNALNQLKGTALKVSQLLSMETAFLPEGIRQELAKACYQATPLNRALIHKVFQQEFGLAPEQLFTQFNPHAFAAASLGQVHEAKLADGTLLAVKVQYPGIATSIRSDIVMLRSVLKSLSLGSSNMPRKEIIEHFMQKIEIKLNEEVDYIHEAEQLAWFTKNNTLADIVFPNVLTQYSSQRVLCMEKLEGLHLDAWLATEPSQAERNHYGQLLFDWFWMSVHQLKRVHADPHPGNFLFMNNGKLGVLDFGCTNPIPENLSLSLARAWNALLDTTTKTNYEEVKMAYCELGLIEPQLSMKDFKEELLPAISPLIEWQLEPYRQDSFDFKTKSPYPKLDSQRSKSLAKLTVGCHEDLPYFDRANMGLMSILTKIQANIKTGNPWHYAR
jgi:predicted unusual protein kinase regulating ubiquinone biosynthesis (AarF/ABC1/UbiB family)